MPALRHLPEQIDIGHENEIERFAPDPLISDAQLAAFGIPNFGWGHGLLPNFTREVYRVARSGTIGFLFETPAGGKLFFLRQLWVEPQRPFTEAGMTTFGAIGVGLSTRANG